MISKEYIKKLKETVIIAEGVEKTEPIAYSHKDFSLIELVKTPILRLENGVQIPFTLNQTSKYDILDFAKEHNQLKSKFKIIVENMYCRKNETKPLFSTTYVATFIFVNDFFIAEKIDFVKPITLYVNYNYPEINLQEDILFFLLLRKEKNEFILCKHDRKYGETLFSKLF